MTQSRPKNTPRIASSVAIPTSCRHTPATSTDHTRLVRSWLLWGLSLCTVACAPGPSNRVDPTLSSETQEQRHAETLRKHQEKALYQFDADHARGEAACTSLCRGQTTICALSQRICSTADKHPQNDKVQRICTKASATCGDTTKRLPQECWCR